MQLRGRAQGELRNLQKGAARHQLNAAGRQQKQMGRCRKRNRFINKTTLGSRHTQNQIAYAIALYFHALNRTTGIEATQPVKAIASSITTTTNAAQSCLAASPLHAIHPAAKTQASLHLSTNRWSLKRRQQQQWQHHPFHQATRAGI